MPAVRVSFEEYVVADAKPARELIDGELLPKPMGTLEHMRMERRLARALAVFEGRGLGEVVWELSMRMGDDIRIRDVTFIRLGARYSDRCAALMH